MKTLLVFITLIFVSCAQPRSQPKLVNLEEKIVVPYPNLGLHPEQALVRAPATFKAKFITSFGDFTMSFQREDAPKGIDRFYSLVKANYFEDILVFRALQGFMFQFGIHGDTAVNEKWKDLKIDDDPLANLSNQKGTIGFASAGPNTRSNQFFINLADNSRLDAEFTPLGKIIEGDAVLDRVNTQYGENSRGFRKKFEECGNRCALEEYPNLDRIIKVFIVD